MNKKKIIKDLFGEKDKKELGEYEPKNKNFKKNKSIDKAKLKKTFNKLRHKAIYLNIEHEEIMENFEEIRRKFVAKMFEFCKDKDVEAPFVSVENKKDNKTSLSNKEINNLFREIVKKTHPDLSKKNKQDQIEFYNEAVQGKKAGDFRKILKVALELNIKIKEVSPGLIDQLNKEIKSMQEQIKNIKNDIMYKWSNSDQNQKLAIFQALTRNQEGGEQEQETKGTLDQP